MKAYSIDLRQKIIDAHNNEEGSQRQLAKRFSVSLSFVQSLLRRFRFCGTVEAKPHKARSICQIKQRTNGFGCVLGRGR
jgi:putative transposase